VTIDPADNVALNVAMDRQHMERSRVARDEALAKWKRAKARYTKTLRTAVAQLDAYGGRTTSEIAKLLGVAPSVVSDVRHGRR
jgi:hypothetical protein